MEDLFNNLLMHSYQPLYKLIPTYQLMNPKVLLTNDRMEDNLETHLEEVHPKEIHLEDHHLNRMLDHLND